MTVKELRSEIFGVHLFGYEQNLEYDFDECIDPQGMTVYRTDGGAYSSVGGLVITDDALACFSYPPGADPSPSCFEVFRRDEGYAFSSVDGFATFVVTEVRRGIAECPKPGSLIG